MYKPSLSPPIPITLPLKSPRNTLKSGENVAKQKSSLVILEADSRLNLNSGTCNTLWILWSPRIIVSPALEMWVLLPVGTCTLLRIWSPRVLTGVMWWEALESTIYSQAKSLDSSENIPAMFLLHSLEEDLSSMLSNCMLLLLCETISCGFSFRGWFIVRCCSGVSKRFETSRCHILLFALKILGIPNDFVTIFF